MSSTIHANPLEWLGTEKDQIRIAFTKVFGSRVRAHGHPATHIGGVSDGREGVQWKVAYDPRDGRQWVAVGLEGKEYDDWPISRLILKELREISLPGLIRKNPALGDIGLLWRRDYGQGVKRPIIQERDIAPTPISLPGLIRKNPALGDVGLLWRRDYGQGVKRPIIQERDIAPTPINLGDLTDAGWHEALSTARDCLNGQRKRLGRATQTVTLPNGETAEGKVSPHLTFRYIAPERVEWESFFREAKARLQPVYDWTVQRAGKPIRF